MYEINGKYTSAKIFTSVEDIDVTEQTLPNLKEKLPEKELEINLLLQRKKECG